MAVADENNVAESMEIEVKSKPKVTFLTSVLESFTDLLHKDATVKRKGATNLLSCLSRAQESDKELLYAVKRLVRTLGSSNASARTTYFSMLVLVLERFPISVTQLLEIVKKELCLNNGTKAETGEVSIGQLMVTGAILRSGLILKASQDECKEFFEIMFIAADKKVYLKSAMYLFLVDVLPKFNADEFKTNNWTHVEQHVKKPLNEQTLDTIYFLMVIKETYPNAIKLKKIIGYNSIINEDTLHAICDKLMDIRDLSVTNHPIYELVGKNIANSEHLELFWTSGIDSHLVKHNRNKEVVAIKLLTTIFNNMTENYTSIPSLISKNFFNLLIDWFKGLQTVSKVQKIRDDEDGKKFINKSAKNLLDCLVNVLKSEKVTSAIKVETLNKLLFNPGDINFSEITGTAIVRSIMADLDEQGVVEMAELLSQVLKNESKKKISADNERSWWNVERSKAADLLSHLVAHRTVTEKVEWRLQYMKILLKIGFFKIGSSKEINGAMGVEHSASMRNSFYRCLNSKMPTANSLVDILRELCDFIEENLSNKDVLKNLEKQVTKESRNCWVTLRKVTKIIEGKKQKQRGKIENVFLILLYQLGLFLFAEPRYVEMAQGSIKELESCYEHYKSGTKNKMKEPSKEGEIYEGEPEWIEVLVEVLLSILSHESSVLRSIVQCVFRLLWEHLTPSSIDQILSVLDPDTDENPLVENDSDISGSDTDSGMDDEPLKKKKKLNSKQKQQENGEVAEDEESDDNSDIEMESEDDDMTKTEQLRMAVHQALGNAVNDSDTESLDTDMIDENEGNKLDKALSEAFKLLGKGKSDNIKKEKKDKKTLTDFRLRVMDLVDIYLEKEPSLDICLNMISPLMHCVEYCVQETGLKDLENRVRKTLKTVMKIRKFSSTDGVTLEILCDNLKAVVEKGDRSLFQYQVVGDLVAEFGSFIVHCSQKILSPHQGKNAKKSNPDCPLVTYYKDSLVNFFTNRKCSLPTILFTKILQNDWVGNYSLLPIIIEHAFNPAVRQFRRQEALELLTVFYVNLKRIRPNKIVKILKPFELQLQNRLIQSLKNKEFEVKGNFFKLLTKLQTAICNFYKSFDEKSVLDIGLITSAIGKGKEGKKKNKSGKKSLQSN